MMFEISWVRTGRDGSGRDGSGQEGFQVSRGVGMGYPDSTCLTRNTPDIIIHQWDVSDP